MEHSFLLKSLTKTCWYIIQFLEFIITINNRSYPLHCINNFAFRFAFV